MDKVVIIFVFEAFPVIDVTKIDNFKQYLNSENIMNQFFCQKIVWNPLRYKFDALRRYTAPNRKSETTLIPATLKSTY